MPAPENDRGAADRAAADGAPRHGLAAAGAHERPRRQPARGEGAQLGRPVDRRGVGGHDHARAAAGDPRVDDPAVDVLRAHDGRRRRVGHVDLADAGAARAVAEHEQAIPVQQERRAPLAELQRAEEPRGLGAGVDRVQRAVGQREDRPAVGLDDVGLVDAGLLHVGLRGVLGRGARGGHRRAARGCARPVERGRLGRDGRRRDVAGGVADQALAGAERLEALGGTGLRGGRGGGGGGGGKREQRQQGEEAETHGRTLSPCRPGAPANVQNFTFGIWRSGGAAD